MEVDLILIISFAILDLVVLGFLIRTMCKQRTGNQEWIVEDYPTIKRQYRGK